MSSVGDGWEVDEDVRDWSDWTWFKVRAGQVVRLVLLSEAPLWYAGHFSKGRMVPCEGAGCKLCAAQIGRQVRYVFGAAAAETGRTGLIEVGKATALQIRDWIPRRGGLRGMVVAFAKATFAKQSRTEVEFCDVDAPGWAAGLSAPDVRRALEATWTKAGFPLPGGNGSPDDRTEQAKQKRVRFAPPSAGVTKGS